jgi:hypothetical protein
MSRLENIEHAKKMRSIERMEEVLSAFKRKTALTMISRLVFGFQTDLFYKSQTAIQYLNINV